MKYATFAKIGLLVLKDETITLEQQKLLDNFLISLMSRDDRLMKT